MTLLIHLIRSWRCRCGRGVPLRTAVLPPLTTQRVAVLHPRRTTPQLVPPHMWCLTGLWPKLGGWNGVDFPVITCHRRLKSWDNWYLPFSPFFCCPFSSLVLSRIGSKSQSHYSVASFVFCRCDVKTRVSPHIHENGDPVESLPMMKCTSDKDTNGCFIFCLCFCLA